MDPVYTPKQKEAACRLINVDGLTPAEAVARLAEGAYDLEPFEMNKETARIDASKVRNRMKEEADAETLALMLEADPQLAVLETFYRLLWLLQRATDELTESGKNDPDTLNKLIRGTEMVSKGIAGRRRPDKPKLKQSDTVVSLTSRLRERDQRSGPKGSAA